MRRPAERASARHRASAAGGVPGRAASHPTSCTGRSSSERSGVTTRSEPFVERRHRGDKLLVYLGLAVVALDPEPGPQDLRRLAGRAYSGRAASPRRTGSSRPSISGPLKKFVHKPGLAHTGLAGNGDDLAAALFRVAQRVRQIFAARLRDRRTE